MGEYIEREVTCKDCICYEMCAYARANGDGRVLKNSPCKHFKNKADVAEVRHGKWKFRKNWDFFVCSECSFEHTNYSRYCPNCGAKMDGKENNGKWK